MLSVIKRILKFIRSRKRFLVTAHARVDGDALGCELTIARWLRKMGKQVTIINTGGISPEYRFLPGIQQVHQISNSKFSRMKMPKKNCIGIPMLNHRGLHHSGQIPNSKYYDAIIVLDAGGFKHLELVKDVLPSGCPIINIDHHPSNDYFGVINWVDAKISCTGEMVYQLIKASRVPLDKSIALALYVALITDTGNFSFSTTTPASHRMAADLVSYGINPRAVYRHIYEDKPYAAVRLHNEVIRRIRRLKGGGLAWTEITQAITKRYHSEPADSEEYLRVLKSLKETQIAVLFREGKNSQEGTKVSIRTTLGIDANRLMVHFGGGGHHRAAGCTIHRPFPEARRIVLAYLIKQL